MEITEAGPQSKWILLQISNKDKMTTNTQLGAFRLWLAYLTAWCVGPQLRCAEIEQQLAQ